MKGLYATVDAPSRRVGPFNLVAAAQSGAQVRWQLGVTWADDLTNVSGGVWPQHTNKENDGGDGPSKTVVPTHGISTAEPFTVWVGDRCNPTTADIGRMVERLRRFFDIDQHRQIEAEVWSGQYATAAGFPNPVLASADAKKLSIAPVDPVTGLAGLQEALATVPGGGVGVIHATRRTVAMWGRYGMVTREGNALVDLFGNRVVPGAGYDGSGPPGETITPGLEAWAYATGPIAVEVGGDLELQDLDQRANRATVRLERTVAAWFDKSTIFGVPIVFEEQLGS